MVLLHCCISVRSVDTAKRVIEDLLGYPMIHSFDIPPETVSQLFQINQPVRAFIFDAVSCHIEVFEIPEMPPPGQLQHICLECDHRDRIVKRASEMGFTCRRLVRENSDIVFIVDDDGNLFELKQRPER